MLACPHVSGQVGQHRGTLLPFLAPPFDVGVGEVVAEAVRSRPLASRRSGETGLVPDTVEHLPTVAAVTWLPVVDTKNVRRDRPNRAADIRSQPAGTSVTSLLSGSRRERCPWRTRRRGCSRG